MLNDKRWGCGITAALFLGGEMLAGQLWPYPGWFVVGLVPAVFAARYAHERPVDRERTDEERGAALLAALTWAGIVLAVGLSGRWIAVSAD